LPTPHVGRGLASAARRERTCQRCTSGEDLPALRRIRTSSCGDTRWSTLRPVSSKSERPMDSPGAASIAFDVLCSGEDLNLQASYGASTSSWCVCQFHHRCVARETPRQLCRSALFFRASLLAFECTYRARGSTSWAGGSASGSGFWRRPGPSQSPESSPRPVAAPRAAGPLPRAPRTFRRAFAPTPRPETRCRAECPTRRH
jgi:hypothetical protein